MQLSAQRKRRISSTAIKPRAKKRRFSVAHRRSLQYRDGFNQGYQEGIQSGMERYPMLFEGTSIIIPTFNQLNMLAQCIQSIIQNTSLRYEIIVVDNASTDGTAHYLEKLGGQVRYRILDTNRGFAGAINVGLMMAKGNTLMLLNNDTLVTENGLSNLLTCLHSDDGIGMVGPVTNYISGRQQIPVPYKDVADMPHFARVNNQSDPTRWHPIDRLTGFCLLFRRELFEGIGYLDEGFEIGNFEDDDYNIRVRLLGKSLVVAEDAFIHHFGSVSMKALGDQFQEVNDRNETYFINKWPRPYEWIQQVKHHPELKQGALSHTSYYYPEHIIVRAAGDQVYWIEQGARRPVEGTLSLPIVRISQVDLRRWPFGERIAASEVESCWQGAGSLRLPDASCYHVERNKVRPITSQVAMQAWGLHVKSIQDVSSEELANWEQGLPIIAPPVLRYMK